ncbi:Uncharacterized protein FKW44_014054 [Caligus rogercresseyi]|uniref:Uncharacterized protein n=1 Tax=Caligus rogercresseyi TaxID=217165 RepID=A0A7T8GYB9_CALRO|nr:Uncharacterized protein FKW44_014054 [Caligus rogercresseyi]
MQDPKKYDWIRDPFSASPPADLSTSKEEQFIDVNSDSTMRLQFQSKTLAISKLEPRFDKICSMKQTYISH